MANSRFTGTSSYIATDDLSMAVNAAVTLQRPILVKGEPGTGKTQLAIEVAKMSAKSGGKTRAKAATTSKTKSAKKTGKKR